MAEDSPGPVKGGVAVVFIINLDPDLLGLDLDSRKMIMIRRISINQYKDIIPDKQVKNGYIDGT